jgi:hypothetical protein
MKGSTRHTITFVSLLLVAAWSLLLAGKRAELKSVNGSGIDFTINQTVFTVNWMLPDPIPSLQASLTIFNSTPEPREFALGSSSCPFDIVIKDNFGNIVFHLIASRRCTRDLLTVTLTNEAKVFEEVVRLQNGSGKPLGAGTYWIQATVRSIPVGEPTEFTIIHMR